MGVNKHLAEMFGLPPEDFLGKDIGFLRTGSEFRNFIENFFQRDLKDDSTEIFAHIDGKIRNYILVAHKFGQGESTFVVGIDNTERKQAETKLRRANDQLEAVLEAVPGMVSWISADLHYLGVNRHLAHKFDLTPQDFVGRHIGFLNSSLEFQDFVEKFFVSPHQEAFEEISSFTNDRVYTFLLVAQKYNQSKSAFIVGIDISDRKQAEAKYKNIFENAVEGIFQATIHGKFLTANPGMAKIFGYGSPEELIHDFNHNEHQIYADPEVKQQFLDLLITHHRVERFEAQVLQKNGKAIWILISAHGLRNNQGQVISFDGIIEDITEQREAKESLQRMNEELELRVERRTAELSQANEQLQKEIKVRERIEDALRNSEAELRVLFEAMTDVITVFDAEGRYVKIVNTNSEVLYNPPADRLSKRVHDVLPKEQADLFVEKIQEVLRTQRTVSVEYSVPVDHGSDEIWFAASVSPMPNRSVIWVARNITERRRMVNAIQKAEEKYRTIFENTAEGIFQASYDGAIISANPALVAMYGYQSEGELINALTDINTQLYVIAIVARKY
ncbi:MAG: PAS domain S-box protein [Synechococcaceae cyanobacterium RL_1_2]|nr:PAS domain S-box protein [Synechococcaceae cyanobacterium RL_1_2]